MADTSGWGMLGQALAGGGQAELRGQANGARIASLLLDAEKKRDEQLARDQLQGAIASAGGSPEQASLLATALRGGFDPTKISTYNGAVQEQGFRGNSVAAALAGDWGGANANLMGVANGPVDLAAIQGQNLINNRLLPGGGGISTTEQGQAGIKADAARAAASYASANSSNASAQASLGRLGIAQQQFALQKSGQWNPGGKVAAALTGGSPQAGTGKPASAGIGADWNPRQRAGVQGVQRNLLAYAAALTGKSPDLLRAMSAEEIAKEVSDHGGRVQQGAVARVLEGVPFLGKTLGRLSNEISNSDILSYSQGAGSAWAGFENPTGPITNADRESATLQMPSYLDPANVQASKIRNFLELSGYQPSGAAMPAAAAAPPVRIQNSGDYNALPSGAQYIAPDGSLRRKR